MLGRLRAIALRVAAGMGLGSDDAEDVAQATALSLLKHRDRIRSGKALSLWVRKTARRHGLKLLRKKRMTSALSEAYEVSDGESVEEMARSLDFQQLASLRRALDQLSGRDRMLMQLIFEEQAPYAEISKRTGIPVGSIGPTRSRVLARLRTLMRGGQEERHAVA